LILLTLKAAAETLELADEGSFSLRKYNSRCSAESKL